MPLLIIVLVFKFVYMITAFLIRKIHCNSWRNCAFGKTLYFNQIGSWKVNPVCMYNSICVYIICIILHNRSSGNSYSEQVVLLFYTLLFWKILNCSQKWLHSLINIFEEKKILYFFLNHIASTWNNFKFFHSRLLRILSTKSYFTETSHFFVCTFVSNHKYFSRLWFR